MGTKINIVACLGIVILFFFSCETEKKEDEQLNEQEYYKSGSAIKVDSFNGNQIVMTKYFDLDSIYPKGPEIHYNPNRSIKKWIWYQIYDKKEFDKHPYPVFGLNFDSMGNYIDYSGLPFLQIAIEPDEHSAIELAYPPMFKPFFVLHDSLGDKLIKKHFIGPGLTDSTCWIGLDFRLDEPGHKYKAWYYLMDMNNNRFDSASVYLTTNKYTSEYEGLFFIESE